MSSDSKSNANPQELYNDLSNEVADTLLGPNSPVRGSAEFDRLISEHDQLLSRQEELKDLEKKLTEVLPGLEQTEGNLSAAQKQLAVEKKKLAAYAGELGQAAFAGLRSGELPDHQIFSDRKELQSRIENLQRQRTELTADENAGMMDKAKIQAQQLKLKGQIKLEELKINSVDRAIGEAILKSKEKLSVRCDQTEKVLKAIIHQRKQVTTAKEKLEQAEAAVADRKSAAAQILGRSNITNAASLKSELKETRKEYRQNEQAITKSRNQTVNAAVGNQSLRKNALIGEKLQELETISDSSAASYLRGIRLIQSVYSSWQTLPFRLQIGVASASIVAVLLFMALGYFQGEASTQLDETMGDASQFRIVEKIENADKSLEVQEVRGDDTSTPLSRQTAKPSIAKWNKWPEPDEIVAEMGSLTMLQATTPVNHSFTVLKQISEGVYEIQIELPIQSKGRAVLSTVTTKFESDGRAMLPLTYSGTQSFTLQNGFKRQIRIFQEASALSPKEAAIREREYFNEMKALRRMLVCSSIHFNVPITGEWKDFYTAVGADKWDEMISDDSLYLSKRAKNYFSIEVSSAYRETKEAMEKGYSPTHYAAQKRDLMTLNALNSFGESLSELGDVGRPPLHVAFESCLEELTGRNETNAAKRLLDWFANHDASVKQVDSKQRNLVHLLALNSQTGLDESDTLLGFLQKRGFNFGSTDSQGNHPVHLVLHSVIEKTTDKRKGRPSMTHAETAKRCGKILDLFAKYGADLRSRDNKGYTLIHKACEVADVELLKIVLEKDINVDQKNKSGDTPLLLLSKHWGDVEERDRPQIEQSVQLLLEKNANKLIRDSNGHFAAFHLGDSLRHLLLVETNNIPITIDGWDVFLFAGKDAFFAGTASGSDHRFAVLTDSGSVLKTLVLDELSGPVAAHLNADGSKLRLTDSGLLTSAIARGSGQAIPDSEDRFSLKLWEVSQEGKVESKTIRFNKNYLFPNENVLDKSSTRFSDSGIIRYENVHTSNGADSSVSLASYGNNGRELWRYDLSKLSKTSFLADGLIQVMSPKSGTATLLHNGKKVASYDIKAIGADSYRPPTGVAITEANVTVVRTDDSVVIIGSDGNITGRIPVGYGPKSTFQVFGNLAIVGNRENDVFCIDTSSAKKLWKARGNRVDGGLQQSRNGEWFWISGSKLVRYSPNGELVGKCLLPGFKESSSSLPTFDWLGESKFGFLSISEEGYRDRRLSLYLNVIDISEW
ncbi:hypothetical protein [Gimesia sp.]|uniref:hypothetical protein n=1 Tax=Gimesia sp. TaxID=2024833 RepID=UPI0032EFD5F2